MATETAERATTRNTIQRALVLEAVQSLHNHPTSADVYEVVRERHPNISRATVYRNLGVLANRITMRSAACAAACSTSICPTSTTSRRTCPTPTASPSSTTRSSSTAYARSARRRGSPSACSPAMPSAPSSARFFWAAGLRSTGRFCMLIRQRGRLGDFPTELLRTCTLLSIVRKQIGSF